MSIPSLMLAPGGWERCRMSRHLPDFLGTAPSGFTTKLGSGGERKGPAVCPARHSVSRYDWVMVGRTRAERRLEAE